MKRIPKKILVFIMATRSSPFDNLTEKICVTMITIAKNNANTSTEKNLNAVERRKNHKDNPNVTANALKRGDDNSILYRINQCY